MLQDRGWMLSPAYDMNPVASGGGLSLNISKDDNRQDLSLVLSVAHYFRLSDDRANDIVQEVLSAVKRWPDLAKKISIPSREVGLMKSAFKVADG